MRSKGYELRAWDAQQGLVMFHWEEKKSTALMGFDIWCDASLDETGEIVTVELVDLDTDKVILTETIR